MRDQLLVGGDHGLARVERTLHPATRRLDAAHQLDHDVGGGVEHVADVFRPPHSRRHPVDALAGDPAIEDVRQLHAGRRLFAQDAGDGRADRAEAKERDAAACAGIGRGGVAARGGHA
jgi:hypothetical protein